MKNEKEKVITKVGYWLPYEIMQTTSLANTPTSR